MRLSDYESKIKSLIEVNREDPQIYTNLQEMIYYYLIRGKKTRGFKDAEDISYILAGDIFMKIIQGENFFNYLSYLDHVYVRYILDYYNENDKEILVYDITDNMVVNDYLTNDAYREFHNLFSKMYLKDVEKLIDVVMKQSRYPLGTKEYVNTKLSLALSLLRGYPCGYHLTDDQIKYVRILMIGFYSTIKKDGEGILDIL